MHTVKLWNCTVRLWRCNVKLWSTLWNCEAAQSDCEDVTSNCKILQTATPLACKPSINDTKTSMRGYCSGLESISRFHWSHFPLSPKHFQQISTTNPKFGVFTYVSRPKRFRKSIGQVILLTLICTLRAPLPCLKKCKNIHSQITHCPISTNLVSLLTFPEPKVSANALPNSFC